MKQVLIVIAFLLLSFSAKAQVSDITTGVLLSPFVTATKMLETSAVGTMKSVESTRSIVRARGVAGKEQLKDELMALNEDLMAGTVKRIADVQQPGLKELFEEITANEESMIEVNEVVREGSELFRVATVVTLSLLIE